LEVEVPESLTGAARLLVVNPKGATVVVAQNDLMQTGARISKPPGRAPSDRAIRVKSSANPLMLVTSGSVIADAGIRGMYFVQRGARVTHTGGSCVYFVKDGGQVEGSSGITFVVREPQANATITNSMINTKTQTLAGRRNHRTTAALAAAASQTLESDREVESLTISVVPATFEIVAP
jgi:hypothetical protein